MNDRSLIRWLILAVVVIALLNLPPSLSKGVKSSFRETVRPLERLTNAIILRPWEYLKAMGRSPHLLREIHGLQQEIARLHAERSELRILDSENEHLRKLLSFPSRPDAELIAAEVVARSRDGWWQTIRLNKGAADGIRENLAVISMDGLVGKTVAVSRNTTDVLLLSDPTCRVAARMLRSGSFGVVHGRGPSWQGQVFCRMEYIYKNEELKAGDEVVTSGLGGVFPPGISIGYVDRIDLDPSGLYQQADVITRADLSNVRFVFIMKYHQPNGSGPT